MMFLVLCYKVFNQKRRDEVIRRLSKALVRSTGIKIQYKGTPVLEGPVLIVANHVSWLDIFLLNCKRINRFIAKVEIKSWPIVGWMVSAVGTIYIDRSSRQGLKEINEKMAESFSKGDSVGLFPEGTTTEGFTVLPLFSGLFDVAIKMEIPVQPVALLFTYKGERSGRVAFVGDQSLMKNLWILLSSRKVGVTVKYLPMMQMPDKGELSRQELTDFVYKQLLNEVATPQISSR
ncbi:lysophospholipid acyltransferase family protein [Taylorella equigenitalis]|nr:lysophospholipid acyltransferase family protein [Taylorella equigenitalis]WGQ20551.1 lysophospholipid acyltransferase family protein [Taylorella equigenitalis]